MNKVGSKCQMEIGQRRKESRIKVDVSQAKADKAKKNNEGLIMGADRRTDGQTHPLLQRGENSL